MRVIQDIVGEIMVVCPHCKALLGILFEDISMDESGVLHQHKNKDCFTNCCTCGWMIPLSTKDIPGHWTRKLTGH